MTDNIIKVDSLRGLKAQIDALTANTRVVTLTIGGNDALFAAVLEHCIDGPRRWQDIFLGYQPGWGCSKNKSFVSLIDRRLATLDGGPQPPVIVS